MGAYLIKGSACRRQTITITANTVISSFAFEIGRCNAAAPARGEI